MFVMWTRISIIIYVRKNGACQGGGSLWKTFFWESYFFFYPRNWIDVKLVAVDLVLAVLPQPYTHPKKKDKKEEMSEKNPICKKCFFFKLNNNFTDGFGWRRNPKRVTVLIWRFSRFVDLYTRWPLWNLQQYKKKKQCRLFLNREGKFFSVHMLFPKTVWTLKKTQEEEQFQIYQYRLVFAVDSRFRKWLLYEHSKFFLFFSYRFTKVKLKIDLIQQLDHKYKIIVVMNSLPVPEEATM